MTRKTVKQMLIDLYKEERDQERCQIIHGLKDEAEIVVGPYKKMINELNGKIDELNKESNLIRMEIKEQNACIDRDLKKVKLFTFTSKACGDALHNDLLQFDKKTTEHIKEILED